VPHRRRGAVGDAAVECPQPRGALGVDGPDSVEVRLQRREDFRDRLHAHHHSIRTPFHCSVHAKLGTLGPRNLTAVDFARDVLIELALPRVPYCSDAAEFAIPLAFSSPPPRASLRPDQLKGESAFAGGTEGPESQLWHASSMAPRALALTISVRMVASK
jgi:hypothetical protein